MGASPKRETTVQTGRDRPGGTKANPEVLYPRTVFEESGVIARRRPHRGFPPARGVSTLHWEASDGRWLRSKLLGRSAAPRPANLSHARLPHYEAEQIHLGGDLLVRRGPHAVAGIAVHLKENGPGVGIARGGGLEAGGHFAGVEGMDALVLLAGGYQQGWIFHAGFDVVVRRIAQQVFAAGVAKAPLMDMVRYPKFLRARNWIPEYGSSDDPKQLALTGSTAVGGGAAWAAVNDAVRTRRGRRDFVRMESLREIPPRSSASGATVIFHAPNPVPRRSSCSAHAGPP